MPFQVSPGVNVSEIDLTTIVPSVSSTFGGVAGAFKWGPIEDRVLVGSEDELAAIFGKPNANNFETFYTASNFLAYGNQLYVVRAAEDAYNSYANTGTEYDSTILIKNRGDFEDQYTSLDTTYSSTNFVAKYAGDLGNSLKVSICTSMEGYESNLVAYSGSNIDVLESNTSFSFSLTKGSKVANVVFSHIANDQANIAANTYYANVAATALETSIKAGDVLLVGNTTTGTQYMTVANVEFLDQTNHFFGGNTTVEANTIGYYTVQNITFTDKFKQKTTYTVSGDFDTANGVNTKFATKYWQYHNTVVPGPGTSNYVAARNSNPDVADEVHIVVVDAGGKFTGIPGEILEVWPNLSVAKDARGEQGGSIYYRDVINKSSRYVWSTSNFLSVDGDPQNAADDGLAVGTTENYVSSFISGADGSDENTISVGKILTAYDKFKSTEDVEVSLIMAGKARGDIGQDVANYIIDNICEYRKDCVAFITSPFDDTVLNPGQEMDSLISFRNNLTSSSYAVMDTGYKYQYDKYNDEYRWVPLNGDIAGLCVRTDNLRDPWFSPAGFNRGVIKNVVKLSYNPDQNDRDVLYRNGINPVVTFPGRGTVLYGDKTLLGKPSAFDRINVRRLFITLEKAIAIAARSSLFEFNDDFTRAGFRNLIEPYLRDIKGRRGIYDFKVVCDNTNNTPEVIDANQFRGDIYIKPARSINFIQLNFVAVRTGVEFEEIVGKF
jgi:phage tail sheath protein FI